MRRKTETEQRKESFRLLKGLMYLLIFTAASICILLSIKPVQAASYQYVNLSGGSAAVGGTEFSWSSKSLKAVKDGKTVTLLSVSSGWIHSSVVTNGKTVFAGNSAGTNSVVYKIQVSSQKKTTLFKSKSTEFNGLCGYYKGKLYYTRDYDLSSLWSYNISSKTKKKAVTDIGGVTQKGKYFVMDTWFGSWQPCTLKVYNAATGKTRQITKKMLAYYVGETRIYYVEAKQTYSASGYTVRVRSCRLDGTGKKTLTKYFKISSGGTLTGHSYQYRSSSQSAYKTITF